MQKLVLDATRRSRPGTAAAPRPQDNPGSATSKLDLPLDDDSASAYADTEPMSFMDSRPFNTAEATSK